MIIYFIKTFWNNYGWYFIIYGGLIALLFLWLYNRNQGSFSLSFNDILKKIFTPSTSYSIPKPQIKQDRQSKGEKKCKEFLEYIFNKKFDKIRPYFLTNPITNQPLELDCFNEELKLAIEYNGKQHYEYNKMMHQNSKHAFQNQQYRDHIKKELCEKHGIRLITVPYTIQEQDIPSFLYNELKKYGYSFETSFI